MRGSKVGDRIYHHLAATLLIDLRNEILCNDIRCQFLYLSIDIFDFLGSGIHQRDLMRLADGVALAVT
jgi:hypothetical protein